MIKFNQGKACDAVIRRIEMREGSRRENTKYPEKDRNTSVDERIELACQIGGQLFAFEHTGIEPYQGYTELEAKYQITLSRLYGNCRVYCQRRKTTSFIFRLR